MGYANELNSIGVVLQGGLSKKAMTFKGAALFLEAGLDYASIVQGLANDGGDTVQFVTTNTMVNSTDSAIGDLWTNTNYQAVLNTIKAKGMKIIMKCHVRITNLAGGSSPNPTDKAAWFANWKTKVVNNATLAETNGIKHFVVSNENYLLTRAENYAAWQDIITAVRGVYSGNIGIALAGVYEEDNSCGILDLMDFIGFNLYPKLSLDGASATVKQLKERWFCDLHNRNWIERMRDKKDKYGKPIFVTELGCVPKIGALYIPSKYDWTTADVNQQVMYYQAAMEVLMNCDIIDGVFLWALNGSFSYQGNPTEDVIRQYWR